MTGIGISRLILNSIKRHAFRNGVLAMCVVLVVAMQVAAFTIDRAGRAGVRLGIRRLGADLIAIPRDTNRSYLRAYVAGEAALHYMDASVLAKIRGLGFVEKASPQLYVKSLSGAACCSAWSVFLIGFDPESDFTVRPWLKGGDDVTMRADDIITGAAINVPAGTRMRFYGREFTVAGCLEPGNMGLDTSVFIPMPAARLMVRDSGKTAVKKLTIGETDISAVLVKIRPEAEGGVPRWKAAYLLEKSFPGISVIQPSDMQLQVKNNLSATLSVLYTSSYAVWIMAVLLAGLVYAMAVSERSGELGLLRALGATRPFIFRLIVAESALVAVAASAAGCALSLGLLAAFSRLIAVTLGVPYRWPEPASILVTMLLAFTGAVATCVLAAIVPAARACLAEPYESIRRGPQ